MRRPFDGAARDDQRHARQQREQAEAEGRADQARDRTETAEVRAPSRTTDDLTFTPGSPSATSVTAPATCAVGRPVQPPADGHDVAVDDRMRAEVHRPEHRHDILVHFAVDAHGSHDGHGRPATRSSSRTTTSPKIRTRSPCERRSRRMAGPGRVPDGFARSGGRSGVRPALRPPGAPAAPARSSGGAPANSSRRTSASR